MTEKVAQPASIRSRFAHILTCLPVILILLITTLVYYPGLNSGFIFDDFPYIANNHNIQIDELSISSLLQGGSRGST
ncbi:MAG: hypothetical protein GKR93_09360 [Gammaproteobacteria bacterium]|nr:hypothetical protein [Gammaproteobacteria bacterium]